MRGAPGLLIGHFYFPPHLFNPVSSLSTPPSLQESSSHLFWLIIRFMAVSEQDHIEETKYPIAGIACVGTDIQRGKPKEMSILLSAESHEAL